MKFNSDENIPYATTGIPVPAAKPKVSTDEANYDTLIQVRKELAAALAALYKDFNAFTAADKANTAQAAQDLLVDIKARQIAFGILEPICESVNSTIQLIDKKYREKR